MSACNGCRLGDKWTILTIAMLVDEPRRLNELKRLIGGISQQMLTRTPKALERDEKARNATARQ